MPGSDGAVLDDIRVPSTRSGAPGAAIRLLKTRSGWLGGALFGVLVVAGILGPLVDSQDPLVTNIASALHGPSPVHPLGTDDLGRDVLARIIYGIRISLAIAVAAVAASAIPGAILGVIVGYFEGWLDAVVMRVVDVFLAFPALLLAMVVISIFGTGIPSLIIAIALTQTWLYVRVIRAEALDTKHRDFILGARAAGGSGLRIVTRHVVPNVIPSFIVLSTISLAFAILTSASLSYLGLGPQPPTPELGAMLASGQIYLQVAWWLTIPAGVVILGLTLGANMLGDGLRDALDPRI